MEDLAKEHRVKVIFDFVWRVLHDWGYAFIKTQSREVEKSILMEECVLLPYPVVVRLKSKREYPHCVAFYRNMILDPTEPRALLLTRKNLDGICGGQGQYLGIDWARKLQHKRQKVRPVALPADSGPIESALSATRKALCTHGLVGVAADIEECAYSGGRRTRGSPTSFLQKVLGGRIQKIVCCQYEISYTQCAGREKNIGAHDIVIAQRSIETPNEFVSLVKGGDEVDTASIKQLGWAALINRIVEE